MQFFLVVLMTVSVAAFAGSAPEVSCETAAGYYGEFRIAPTVGGNEVQVLVKGGMGFSVAQLLTHLGHATDPSPIQVYVVFPLSGCQVSAANKMVVKCSAKDTSLMAVYGPAIEMGEVTFETKLVESTSVSGVRRELVAKLSGVTKAAPNATPLAGETQQAFELNEGSSLSKCQVK